MALGIHGTPLNTTATNSTLAINIQDGDSLGWNGREVAQLTAQQAVALACSSVYSLVESAVFSLFQSQNRIDKTFEALPYLQPSGLRGVFNIIVFYEQDPSNGIINILRQGEEISEVTKSVAKTVTTLNLDSYIASHRKKIDTAQIFEHFKNIEELTMPMRRPGIKLENADIANLANLTNLHSLDLTGSEIEDADLVHLANLTNLRSLNLGYNFITNEGLIHLATLTNLQVLNLAINYGSITHAGLMHLSNLINLHSLDLGYHTVLSDECVTHLAKLPAIRYLGLGANRYHATEVDLTNIAKLPALNSIDYSGCKITDACLDHFAELSALYSLNLGHTFANDANIANVVEKLPALRSLGLSYSNVTDAGLVHLEKLKLLENLDLTGCSGFTNAGIARLKETNPALIIKTNAT